MRVRRYLVKSFLFVAYVHTVRTQSTRTGNFSISFRSGFGYKFFSNYTGFRCQIFVCFRPRLVLLIGRGTGEAMSPHPLLEKRVKSHQKSREMSSTLELCARSATFRGPDRTVTDERLNRTGDHRRLSQKPKPSREVLKLELGQNRTD